MPTLRCPQAGVTFARKRRGLRTNFEVSIQSTTELATAGHHAALPYSEAPAFMAALRAIEGIPARALELTVLCATRTTETIGARWAEFDFENKSWNIPASRMKAGVEHRVPLSARAIAILWRC